MRRRRRWKVLRSYRTARLLSNVRVVATVARLGSVDVLCAVLRSSCMYVHRGVCERAELSVGIDRLDCLLGPDPCGDGSVFLAHQQAPKMVHQCASAPSSKSVQTALI